LIILSARVGWPQRAQRFVGIGADGGNTLPVSGQASERGRINGGRILAMSDSGLLVDAVCFNGVWGAVRWSEDLTRLEFEPASENTREAAVLAASGLEFSYGDKPGTLKLEH
jgi:hypothetical protein